MQMSEYLKANGLRFKVPDEVFEISRCLSADVPKKAFAVIVHEDEITVVRALVPGEEAYAGRRYRLISFLVELPMDLVGFLSIVSTALARRGIPIFVISSFRTDHLLVLEQDLEESIEALRSCGFSCER
jgi:hypothetical protein